MGKIESMISEPGEGSATMQLQPDGRVPILTKPIAHKDDCHYVEHQLQCQTKEEGFCGCLDQCSCGSATELELHRWLAVLRPSRIAIQQAASGKKGGRASQRDNDAEV